ncbi:hypothetical protein BGI05_00435 [Snodgrassella alvi]|nr:hypothetical protein BGH97_09250 [Snodgrassella alvi]ORF07393.1 hypothetical protein BGH99_08705 [Snodgrassella alvi]ORF11146.1 hypothetical protein BGI00_07705 [Snodgrassella alvi]ORF12283.1 hypothetical protein BGI02_09475 [Snodgrassella alvi]ORF22963.1 hypothetical protein BGI05_00435 [Snodgrassella alvi]
MKIPLKLTVTLSIIKMGEFFCKKMLLNFINYLYLSFLFYLHFFSFLAYLQLFRAMKIIVTVY